MNETEDLDYVVRVHDEATTVLKSVNSELTRTEEAAVTTGQALARDTADGMTKMAAASAPATSAVSLLGQTAEGAGGKMREFHKVGAELVSVSQLLPGPIGQATASIGQFMSVSGEFGKIAHGIDDLGRAAIGGAKNLLGLGTAGAGAATSATAAAAAEARAAIAIEGEGAAAGTAAAENTALAASEAGVATSAGIMSTALAAIPLVAIAAGIVGVADKLMFLSSHMALFGNDQVAKTKAALAALHDQYGVNETDQTAMGDQYRALQKQLEDLTGSASAHTAATSDQGNELKLLGNIMATTQARLDAERHAQEMSGIAAKVASGYYTQFTTDAENTGAGLDNVQAAAIGAANALRQIPTSINVDINVRTHVNGIGVGGTNVDEKRGQADDASGVNDTQLAVDRANADFAADMITRTDAANAARAAAARRAAHGGGGAGAANAAAAAAARLAAQEIAAAYDQEKTAGDVTLNAAHAATLEKIDDAHTLAAAQIDASHKAADQQIENSHQVAQLQIENAHKAANEAISAARRAVDAQLTEQKRLNAAPVTAAEQAQQAIEDARRLRDLNAQLAADSAKGDQNAVRNDQEALQSFQAQQNIAALRAQQVAADAAAQAAADKAQHGVMDPTTGVYDTRGSLDAKQADEDTTYAQHKADEQTTYEQHKADEQTAYEQRKNTEQATYEARKIIEDGRAAAQKKLFDDHIDALAKSKDASVSLADIETKRYLQQAVAMAKADLAAADTAQEKAAAQVELNQANAALKAYRPVGRASGGPVNAGELYQVNENGMEYFRPGTSGTVIPLGAGGGHGGGEVHYHVHLGGPVYLDKYGSAADELAQTLWPAFERVREQQRSR